MSLHTKLVGVTHNNSDGSSRQSIIAQMNINSRIFLKRDCGNIYDPNAILVVDAMDRQLGFISKELAAELAPKMDAGQKFTVSIVTLTGGDNGYTRGVNIIIN